MAKVRESVARLVKRGNAVKSIIRDARESESCTKWDVVKMFLWCVWYKAKAFFHPVWEFITKYGYALVIPVMICLFLLSLAVLIVWALCSIVWYPLLMWLAPRYAAELITAGRDADNESWWFIFTGSYGMASNFMFTVILFALWGWVWKYLPMSKRRFFIDAAGVALKTLSVDEQLEYYHFNKSSKTVCLMSCDAVDKLFLNNNGIEDLKNICDVYEIWPELAKTLFEGSEEMFKLLRGYCGNSKKKIDSQFIGFLIENTLQCEPGKGKSFSRASELLVVCCENRTLENHQLIMLAVSLGREKPYGDEAKTMLERYFSRHSFPDDVIRQIISFATDQMSGECQERNFELLCKIVRRDGLSTELAERFFSSCDKVQNEKMSDILKVRMDCEKVGYSYDNDENRENWKQYCYLCKDISSDAQLQMKEWQYDIYRACGHKLDKDVLYELLVKRISREDMSYFKKVLDEEMDRVTLSDMGNTLIMMCPWKREIILPLLVAEKEKDNSITL